jgi:DNA-binding LytR/AlgR family response regulator
MVKLKCLVVDDEPLARKGLKEYIREMDILEAVGECNNASDALEFLQSNSVDLIFLDIQMPGQNGLEFLREIKNPPMAIITTAFVEFALESFELDVIDYLVKPIPYNRFVKAAIKAKDFYVAKHITSGTEVVPYIFVKSAGKFERLYLDDILFVEAMQNYIVIHIEGQKHIVYMTLSGMESKLPDDKFMRVHKSYIVALEKVKSIEDHDLIIGSFRIPVSRTLKEQVTKRIMGDNLLKR